MGLKNHLGSVFLHVSGKPASALGWHSLPRRLTSLAPEQEPEKQPHGWVRREQINAALVKE